MKTLIQKIKQFFHSNSAHQAELNRYISKYAPTSSAEVENLITQFYRNTAHKGL